MDLTDFLTARIADDEAKVAYMRDEIQRVKTAPAYDGYRDAFLASLTGIRLWWDVARIMARTWADHPDYDQGWAL